MSEPLSFLGGDEPAERDPAVTEASQEAAVAPSGPTEGESSLSPASAPDVFAQRAEPGQVPISALLDEREKRQAEKAQREVLERQIAEIRAAQQPPAELTRDEHLEVALYDQNLRSSRRFAEREYGKDAIAALHDWAVRRCDEDPVFNHQMRSSDDPYEAACQAYNREQILQTVRPHDLAAFQAWQASHATASSPAPARGYQPAPRAPVPRSLATASGTGGAGQPHTPVGPGQAFGATITR